MLCEISVWTPPARITNEMQRRRFARSNTAIRDFALDTECAGACSANMSKICVSIHALLLMFLEEHGAVLAHARPGRLKPRSYTIAMGCQIGSDIVVVLPHRARRPVLRQRLCCMIHGLRGATNSGCCASWWCMARPWIQSYPPCWRSSFRVCVCVSVCMCFLVLLYLSLSADWVWVHVCLNAPGDVCLPKCVCVYGCVGVCAFCCSAVSVFSLRSFYLYSIGVCVCEDGLLRCGACVYTKVGIHERAVVMASMKG